MFSIFSVMDDKKWEKTQYGTLLILSEICQVHTSSH